MVLSDNVKVLMNMITDAGYEAYAVGGCVRDSLMNRACDDIDITTSAKPDELEAILAKNHIRYIETGLKHGTVTALLNKETYEITTFRSDGAYLDNRRPESVAFVTDLKTDLSRRDFTINAMAYNDNDGIVDFFDGRADLQNKLIRAVGCADKRFKEDALRIMRAIRFSSVLGFEIEEETRQAVFDNKTLLKNISAERIYTELSKLLMGDNVFDVLLKYREVIAVAVPEISYIFNVPQNTKWHIYDVWSHTAKAVEQSPKDLALRYTMLLHDIGKAFCKTTDDNGIDHFKGHQKISEGYAHSALKRLKAPNDIYNRVMFLVPIHDMHIGTDRKKIKKWLSKAGEHNLRDLIAVKRADKLAQNPLMTGEELDRLEITEQVLNAIIEEGEPFTVKDLAVDGNDLMDIGLTGKQIGEGLHSLLEKVIGGELPNERPELIAYLKNNL
ncbi:MAG: CCA tRNA nucleotidyltransferase [Clostridium sp.]|nr:CCA tRNA nucleotidyltransferase [Clostridium sp.]